MSTPLVLTGLPGAGKSSVGREIARLAGIECLDLDDYLVKKHGKTIEQLFSDGEEHFRRLEHEALVAALGEKPGVLMLGGGAITEEKNRLALEGLEVVYLRVSPERAVTRISGGAVRPLLRGDALGTMRSLAQAREPLYRRLATKILDTEGKTPALIARQIMDETGLVPSYLPTGSRYETEPVSGRRDLAIPVGRTDPYEVWVGSGIGERITSAISPSTTRVAVIHPPALADYAGEIARRTIADGRSCDLIEVPEGESAKTLEVAGYCWDRLGQAQLGRADTVIGVGGGTTTDLAGYVAASWLRGVDLIQVPTSLLAMVDAAIGGKTGINTAAGKNLVGAFWAPKAVICDLAYLRTLPVEELRTGLGEVVKSGIIDDEQILEILEQPGGGERALTWDSEDLARLVERTISVKAKIVTEDFQERGRREFLNFGHTLAHAIEKAESFGISHGQAVSIGSVYAGRLSTELSGLGEREARRYTEILTGLGLPVTYSGAATWEALREAMGVDKKARGGDLRFVLLRAQGEPVTQRVDDGVLRRVFTGLKDAT